MSDSVRPVTTQVPPSTHGWVRSPLLWLVAGGVLFFLSQLRWGIGWLAWLVPIPLLRYLRITEGRRSRLLFAGAVFLMMHLTIGKIMTMPGGFFATPMWALPGIVATLVQYLGWDALRRRSSAALSALAFAAMGVVLEWAQYTTELATWGSMANTQIDNLPFLQIVSVFGPTTAALVMYFTAAIVEAGTAGALASHKRWVGALGAAILAIHVWGMARMSRSSDGPEVRVAGVVSDMMADWRFPTEDERQAMTDQLFARSEMAAKGGAQLVVWNEAATFVLPAEQPAFLDRAAALAKAHHVELVAAYAVMLSKEPFRFENKYAWFRADGSLAETYDKHIPVPVMEGVTPSKEPLRLSGSDLGSLAGALCYDYDFPKMGRTHASLGAGLVVVPSSDWRGIDPIHTEMSKLRAIEGGFSVVRPTRAAMSGAYDAFGRRRGQLEFFAHNDRVMYATVPTTRVDTLYARIGDALVALAAISLLAIVFSATRRRGVGSPKLLHGST